MSRRFSLAYLTFAPLGPEAAIDLAAELGCDHVGLRLLPTVAGGDFAPLISDPARLAATQRRIRDQGVSVFDVEIIRITPAFRLADTAAFLATAAALGARAILVAGDDPDLSRLTDNFATLAEAAAPYGLTADLEFMPWTTVKDCRTARAIVMASGAPNGRVLVDTLHAARSTTTLADLAALPAHLVSYVQICDAPPEIPASVEGLLHTARLERLLPGDGGIDLAGQLAHLPDDVPISIEVPNVTGKAREGVDGWCRLALARSRALIRSMAG